MVVVLVASILVAETMATFRRWNPHCYSGGGYVVLSTKDGNSWLTKLINPEINPLSIPQVQAAITVVTVVVLASVGFGLLKRRNKRKNLSTT